MFLCATVSTMPAASLKSVLGLVFRYSIFILPIVFVKTKNQRSIIIALTIISVIASNTLALQQWHKVLMMNGFTHWRIHFATQIIYFLCITKPFLLKSEFKGDLLKKALMFSTCMSLIVLGLSQVRGAIVSFVVIMLALMFFWKEDKRHLYKLVIICGVVVLGVIVTRKEILERFISIGQFMNEPNIKSRFEMWESSVKMFLDYPFFGVGYDQWGNSFRKDQKIYQANTLDLGLPIICFLSF